MINHEECKDIIDVRNCIDEIDRTIIAKLALRSNYVDKAAEFKKSISEVKATDRVKLMIDSRRNWAIENQINPDFIQSLFESIVHFFINKEIAKWSQGSHGMGEFDIAQATIEDASRILALQKRAYVQEAERAGNDYNIDPIIQTLNQMKQDFKEFTILKATKNEQLVGTIRAKIQNRVCFIGRLAVEPIYQRQGIGRALLNSIEMKFKESDMFELFTGINSIDNVEFYSRHGYAINETFSGANNREMIRLRKDNTSKAAVHGR